MRHKDTHDEAVTVWQLSDTYLRIKGIHPLLTNDQKKYKGMDWLCN